MLTHIFFQKQNDNNKKKEKCVSKVFVETKIKNKKSPPTSPTKKKKPPHLTSPEKPLTSPVKTPTTPVVTPTTPTESNVCTADHSKATNYNPNSDRGYFLPGYYKKYPNCTQVCMRCTGVFGTDLKIGTKLPAMCCINQFHKTIKCTHAYCTPCYAIIQGYSTAVVNDKENDDNNIAIVVEQSN
jgi:hypothetical protein